MTVHCFLFHHDYPLESSPFFMFDDVGEWYAGCPGCAEHGYLNVHRIDPRYVLETVDAADVVGVAAPTSN